MSWAEDFVRALHEASHAHLERRYCTADAPMNMADKDAYMWGHPDAIEIDKVLNVLVCQCPHCGLRFTCFPPKS